MSDGNGADRFEALLTDARIKADAGRPVKLSIRVLLRHVGAERRGTRVLEDIQAALDRHGLSTEPSFRTGWVDNRVSLIKSETVEQSGEGTSGTSGEAPAREEEVALTVRNLESATAGVTTVDRTSDLLRARALMLRYDFSQLAVMSGTRQVVGAVSWESMALAAIRSSEFTLADATDTVRLVSLDDDLISLIPLIAATGFVMVQNPDRTLSGIVTTADLSVQFATLAGPFLLIGEIERRLRQALAARFETSDLALIRDPADTHRTIDSANDLTLGETLRFLESRANWDRLRWPVERVEFVAALDEVREIRNEVMHFSPDPLSKAQQQSLVNFVGWLRAMEAS